MQVGSGQADVHDPYVQDLEGPGSAGSMLPNWILLMVLWCVIQVLHGWAEKAWEKCVIQCVNSVKKLLCRNTVADRVPSVSMFRILLHVVMDVRHGWAEVCGLCGEL